MNPKCRCGHEGSIDHPCHWAGYTCGKPAKQYFVNLKPVALAGVTLKFNVSDTWACDEHWSIYQKMRMMNKGS